MVKLNSTENNKIILQPFLPIFIMKFTFFTLLSSKFSIAMENMQSIFTNNSKNPVYNSFNLYVKEDLTLALDLCKNGYLPTKKQLDKLHTSLIKESSKNRNFLFKYNSYYTMLPDQAIINYCLHHNLSNKCKNEKTTYDNFQEIFNHFSQKEGFSEKLYSQLKNSIYQLSLKVSNLKPKYAAIHAFELDYKEEQLCAHFRANIYNCLVLVTHIVKSMDQFVSLRTTIEQSVEKIENNIQKHNVRIIDFDGQVIHYNKNNHAVFNTSLLRDWVDFIVKYDTKKLQKELIAKIKEPQEKAIEKIIPVVVNINQVLENEINSLKNQLNSNQQQQIERIQTLYKNIHNDMFEKKQHHQLDSLYKDLPNVLTKFLSIHPDYRTTLHNVEGKNPEQLMVSSLDTIEKKFTSYLEEINHDKITDLSIVGRAIKMKA